MEVLIKNIIKDGQKHLKQAEIADWKQDSFLLAEFVFGITKTMYYANPELKVDVELADKYHDLINKRCKKIPLQHITGVQEFMGLPFKVNEHVLIPRQDTELLVETVLDRIQKVDRQIKVLDLCTGSGCIAIAIDKLCDQAEVFASDISKEALKVARENNRQNETKVTFIHSNLFENIDERFDVIVSNPPYIKTAEINMLMEEVKGYDPIIALDGDEDGLKFYREIAKNAYKYLKKDGMIYFEIGNTQAKQVKEILDINGFKNIVVKKDLSLNDRVIFATSA